jgi:hypothetical protein
MDAYERAEILEITRRTDRKEPPGRRAYERTGCEG